MSRSGERIWLKAREVAEREQVALRTVRRWVDKGILKKSDLGPRLGVRLRYVNAREEGH